MINELNKPRYRVLVVDDEQQYLDNTQELLGNDFTVTTATSCSEAVQKMQQQPFDAALVDYRMPQQLGTVLLQQLRVLNPQCLRLLVTANSDQSILQDAINQGQIDRFVSKPVDYDTLIEDLRAMLEVRYARQNQADASQFVQNDMLVALAISGLTLLDTLLVPAGQAVVTPATSSPNLLQQAATLVGDTLDDLLLAASTQAPNMDLELGNLATLAQTVLGIYQAAFPQRSLQLQPHAALAPMQYSSHAVQRALSAMLTVALGNDNQTHSVTLALQPSRPATSQASQLCLEVTTHIPSAYAQWSQAIQSASAGTPLPPATSHDALLLRYCQAVARSHGGTLSLAQPAAQTQVLQLSLSTTL